MQPAAAQAAADLLHGHWRAGTRLARLPEALRPASRGEGYAIQARFAANSGAPPFGWKIAATSAAGQAHIGVGGPLAGRILRERVIAAGDSFLLRDDLMRVAELEFAFRFGQALPPSADGYALVAVLDRVATLHPAIEFPDSRFERFESAGEAQLIADNACGHAFLLGPAAPETWRGLDLAAHRVVGRIDGGPPRVGIGSNVLGDPRTALLWLVAELGRIGETIEAGEVVTTGTCVLPMPIGPGDLVEGDFGELGRVAVRCVAADGE